MKRDLFAIKMLSLIVMFLFSGILCADDWHDDNDCPLVVVPEFDDTVLLTREERIQIMDQALKDALDQVRDCRQTLGDMKKVSNNSSGSANPDVSGSGAGLNAINHEGDIKTEQAAIDDTGLGQSNTGNMQPARSDSELSGTEIYRQEADSMPSGTLPQDIPPVDNDDVVARQIRDAASSEPDPERQAKLWNEYRRYKGMSEK